MPRLTVKTIPAENHVYFENVLEYVGRKDKCQKGYIGLTNAYLPKNISQVVPMLRKQMQDLRYFYHQEDNRLGIHIILTFGSTENLYLDQQKVLEIGYHIAMTEFSDYVTYFGVHDHTDYLHLDMLMIPINVHSGLMYGCCTAGWTGIVARVQRHLENYMPREVVGQLQVSYDKA